MWADIFCRFQEMSILKFSPVAVPWLQAAGLFGVGPLSVNGNMAYGSSPHKGNWLKLTKENFCSWEDRVDLLFPIPPSKYN